MRQFFCPDGQRRQMGQFFCPGGQEEPSPSLREPWKKNIGATKYYARVRPKKIPSLLKTAMKLTDAEVETYFGETMALLEETNKAP